MIFALFVGLCLSVLLVLFLQLHVKRDKWIRVPPGPKGTFFTGIKDQLTQSPWKLYAQWAEHYQSPIISFWIYNRRIIVLNDQKSVRDILDKRAPLYSDRPKSWMYHELCGRGKSVFNISSLDKRHGKYRRLLQHGLSGRAIREYHDLLDNEANVFVESMIQEPDTFQHHLRRNAAAVIMKIAYGYTLTENDDPFIRVAEESAKISGWALAPGRWIVDYYPIVRFIPSWFPFAQFKRQGDKWRKQLESLSDVPHNWVKKQMEQPSYMECFTTHFLRRNADAEAEDIVKWAAGGLYAGASDTTVSALTSFILLMALHPDVQETAQREITDFCGTGKYPSVTDLQSLHYLNALFKEVLRYAPVSNIALPHRVIQDDVYQSHFIPKDSTVIANTWAILHDPALYPEPFEFKPSRFVDNALIGQHQPRHGDSEDSKHSKYSKYSDNSDIELNPDPRAYCFGYGRRTCPGMQLAEISILLIMSRVLSKFKVSLPVGVDPAPHIEFTSGITSHVKPFDVDIIHRQ
ncbi:cytochrome P450 [Lentinula aciculospora]|uniref:Cytochrome P450 n=1 Tax=Lentinula aciculospora TaxID=153920 RepID=A0A9W9A7B1_9AGAR|nr:cytochrome P450 [Lentinula aciculospora]